MKRSELEALAAALRAGPERAPIPYELLKSSPVRRVLRSGEVVLKLFREGRGRAAREAAALRRARERTIPVPELLAWGDDWVATRWVDGRPARREDLPALLEVVERMHEHGMLHRDLHLGNFLVHGEGIALLDVQRAIFLPHLPHWLRRWELGRLAYSLGEPLPDALQALRFWRDLRAQQHGRSRTRRCLRESSRFTRFEHGGASGFRLRDADPRMLAQALDSIASAERIWERPGGHLYRSGAWILKQHPHERQARSAWINGHGLEARGIRTALPVAWVGRWLVMEDAGRTIVDWIEAEFTRAPASVHEEMMRALADLMAALHRGGIYHSDMKACNIVWEPGRGPQLLDYAKVIFLRRVSRRRRLKNLAQLNSALPDVVPGPLRDAAFERYLERSGFRGDASRLRREVIEMSLKRAHRWHGC
ncbi:MAG: lipopolysaccharide kinase InaA family protein [Myxococcota bacterium]